jgi:hypothetical protein
MGVLQGIDELAHQVDDRRFVLPGFLPVNAVQRIRDSHCNHVEVIQQDDQVPSMPPAPVSRSIA